MNKWYLNQVRIFFKILILIKYNLVTIIRPVVLLGPLADIARDRLLNQYPDKFESPGKWDFEYQPSVEIRSESG